MRRRPLAMAVGVALTAALALREVASAQLIFDRGSDIWAAQDDGSGAHVLVTAASLGMDQGLGDPAVAPDGTTLLFDGGTHAHPTTDPLSSSVFYGDNAWGVYALSGGAVRRLSGAARSTGTASETNELMPEPGPGGTYVYEHQQCVPQTTYYNLPGKSCGGWLRSAPVAQGAAGQSAFATPCDGDMGIPSTPPADPSPDPASGSERVAYVGCEQAVQGAAGITTDHDRLIVSGPGGQGQVTIATAPGASNAASGEPDLADPSWSPDGSQIVVYSAGGSDFDPLTAQTTTTAGGLYVYGDLGATNAGRLALADPLHADGTADWIRSPRFTGDGRIVFVLDGSVYAIPASCNACTMADAKLLHAGGADASTQSFGVAWTSGTIAPAGTAPSGTSGVGGSDSGGTTGSAGLRLSLSVPAHQRLRALTGRGLAVGARCTRACRLSLRLTVAARTARRHGLISARAYRRHHGTQVTVGRAGGRLAAGREGTVRVALTRRARRGLRRAGRLTLRLQARARGGGARAQATRKVGVRP